MITGMRRIGHQTDILGESPVWDDREQALYWCDIRSLLIRRYDWRTERLDNYRMPEMPGCIGFRESGGLVVALKTAICFFDPKTGKLDRVAAPEEQEPNMRFNDGRCDRQGRFWAGTMEDITREPVGTLYRLDHDHSCHAVFGGIRAPNGLCWSLDSTTMYFADSYSHNIEAFEFDAYHGTVGNRREIAKLDKPSHGDGSVVDSEGFFWNAECHGWRVRRYGPDGRIDRTIDFPMQCPTCCAFGGPDLDILFVTTASYRLTPEQLAAQPLAGALLAIDVGVKGVPECRFQG